MSNSQPQHPQQPQHPSPAGPMRIISPIALQTGIVVGSLVYSTRTSTGIFAALATDQSVRFVGMGLAAGVGMTSQAVVGGLYGVAAGAAASVNVRVMLLDARWTHSAHGTNPRSQAQILQMRKIVFLSCPVRWLRFIHSRRNEPRP